MKNNIKICFLADRHDLFDDRIYWKMAVPLKKMGFLVYYLLVGEEYKKGRTKEGIYFEQLKVNTFSGNIYFNFILKRLNPQNNYKKLLRLAEEINADIYHFHDLWINLIGKKLKKLNQKPVVFYDVREPYAIDLISFKRGRYLSKKVIRLFAHYLDIWEKECAKNYDLVIANELNVREEFRKKLDKKKVEVLYNYTDIHNRFENIPLSEKEFDFIYCGGITAERGIFNIVEAAEIVVKKTPKFKILILGKFSPLSLKEELKKIILSNKLNENIILHNPVNYTEVSNFYNKSRNGIITWLPVKSLTLKMPIKIFEYMAFGLPIIGSNFGNIRNTVENINCGILVDPEDSNTIANAMLELLSNEKIYNYYSKNGRESTLERFKWENEFEKLLFYYYKALDERKNF